MVRKWSHSLSIKAKIISSFVIILLLMGILGISGIFSLHKIASNIEFITNVTSPISQKSTELVDNMREISVDLTDMLKNNNMKKVKIQTKEILDKSKKFEIKLSELLEIISSNNINLSTITLYKTQSVFFDNMSLSLLTQQKVLLDFLEVEEMKTYLKEQESKLEKIKKDKTLKLQYYLKTFNEERKDIDKLLITLLNNSTSKMNSKEDMGKTMSQSNDVTIEEMGALLDELFNEDYYLISGITKLQNYILQLQDLVSSSVFQKDTTKLLSMKKQFLKTSKKFRSRLKRLNSRIKSKYERSTYEDIQKKYTRLEKIIIDGDLYGTIISHVMLNEYIQVQRIITNYMGTNNTYSLLGIKEYFTNSAEKFNHKLDNIRKEINSKINLNSFHIVQKTFDTLLEKIKIKTDIFTTYQKYRNSSTQIINLQNNLVLSILKFKVAIKDFSIEAANINHTLQLEVKQSTSLYQNLMISLILLGVFLSFIMIFVLIRTVIQPLKVFQTGLIDFFKY